MATAETTSAPKKPDGRSSPWVRWNKTAFGTQATVGISVFVAGCGGLAWLYRHREESRRREEESRRREEASLPFAERAAVAKMLEPFTNKIITSKLEEKAPNELWVDRLSVLQQLEPLRLTSSKDGMYVVILGEKGTGKSFVAYKLVLNQPGVVYLLLDRETRLDEVYQKLLEATGFDVKQHPTSHALPRLQDLLRMVKEELASEGLRPIVVVEIERTADPDVVDTVFHVLKNLSAESRGFAIITDALATVQMSPDRDRRDEVWVPDFTEAEARAYLGKASEWRRAQGKSSFSDTEIDDIITRLGSRPATLFRLAASSVPPVQFVENCIEEEACKISDLLKDDPAYASVLRALLDSETLSHAELTDLLDQPIKEIAATAMAKRHVLSYNPVRRCAQFHSVATTEAARRWAAKERANQYWWRRWTT